jgi:hypothetical protein
MLIYIYPSPYTIHTYVDDNPAPFSYIPIHIHTQVPYRLRPAEDHHLVLLPAGAAGGRQLLLFLFSFLLDLIGCGRGCQSASPNTGERCTICRSINTIRTRLMNL